MIEIRIQKSAKVVTVLKDSIGQIILIVPENLAWADLKKQIKLHLGDDEISLARKIWCDDEFPRRFEKGRDYLSIRADI